MLWELPLHGEHQNRKTVRSSKNTCRCQKKNKKPCLFFLHLLQHGWKFWRWKGPGTNLSEPRGGLKIWSSAAGKDGAHSLTTLSSGSNHSTPGKTYPDVLLVGLPTPLPHRRTFMGHTWATYHGGLVSKFSFLLMSTFIHLLYVCHAFRQNWTLTTL